jgi:hypothetical protein
MTINGIDFKCWQLIVLSIVNPTLYAHGFMPLSQPVDENLVRSILQALPPIYCPFFHLVAASKGLWTSRSTPALWARCAASHFRPTNVLRIITPAETSLIGFPFFNRSQRTLSVLLCYLMALSVRFSFKLGDYPPCSDFILLSTLPGTQV